MSDRAFYGPVDSWLEDKQVVFAEEYHKLERELAEAKASEVNQRNTSQSLVEECERLHAECVKIDKQLTAHKAALEKCYQCLVVMPHPRGCSFKRGVKNSCICGLCDAQVALVTIPDEIANLKGVQ